MKFTYSLVPLESRGREPKMWMWIPDPRKEGVVCQTMNMLQLKIDMFTESLEYFLVTNQCLVPPHYLPNNPKFFIFQRKTFFLNI